MCGVAGIFAYHYAAPEVDREELRRIRDSMSSRGPDGTGEWYSSDGRAALGHRRLAVIDLSTSAAQPMQNEEGSLVISFNGEIYNYQELRSGLQKKGRVFHSHSDTEVLLHLYAEKGEAMIHDLRGMFAFILWDAKKKIMLLARDPYGIKPLYYADDGWTIRIASQVKALLASEKVSRLPEPAGMAGFFLMGSVPEPYTTYQEIRQVPAGSMVTINSLGPSSPERYFSISEIFSKGGAQRTVPPQESATIIRDALLDSVRHHLIADVPVGVFLSAGIDSGSLVAFARETGVKNLQTVTLAFDEFEHQPQNEAPLAREIASLYGAQHHTRILSADEFGRDLPKVFEAMDQPSIDGINTYFVSKAAKEMGLKVALSGLGGDELFGGYPSFQQIPRLVRALALASRVPFLGDVSRHLFHGVHSQDAIAHPKYAGLLKYGGTYEGAYFLKRGLFMPWELEKVMNPEMAREGMKRLRLLSCLKKAVTPDPKTSFGRIAVLEASFYMRNQLLRDTDWAGMAHGLEIRTPFVDAWLLKKIAPVLVSHFTNAATSSLQAPAKKILIDALKTPLPKPVLHRSKTGFGVPVEKWLGVDKEKNVPWARRWACKVMERQKGEKAIDELQLART